MVKKLQKALAQFAEPLCLGLVANFISQKVIPFLGYSSFRKALHLWGVFRYTVFSETSQKIKSV